jgi:hypothetical protein
VGEATDPQHALTAAGICEVYRDAMRHAGLTPLEASNGTLPVSLTGSELRVAVRAELLPLISGMTDTQNQIATYIRSMPAYLSQRLLVELLSRDLIS